MTRLYLPVGPAGCGKTSLAEGLVSRNLMFANAIVSPDEYRERITGRRGCLDEDKTVFHVAQTIAATRLRRQLDVWFDATNLRPPHALLQHAAEARATIVMVPFNVRPEVLEERNRERRRMAGGHPIPDEALERQIDRMAEWRIDFPGDTWVLAGAGEHPIVPAPQLVEWVRRQEAGELTG